MLFLINQSLEAGSNQTSTDGCSSPKAASSSTFDGSLQLGNRL